MKKLLILAIMGFFLISCGGKENKNDTNSKNKKNACDCLKDAEDLASDLEYKFDHWNTLIREHEESKEPVTLEPEIENEDILKVPAKEVSVNNIQTQ